MKPTADYRQALDAAVREFEELGQKRREIDDRLFQLSHTIGALNRLGLTPIIAQSSDLAEPVNAALRRLGRNLIIEIVLGMVILLIVGHMGVTPPARHVQPQWPFSFRWDWTSLEKAPKVFAAAGKCLS